MDAARGSIEEGQDYVTRDQQLKKKASTKGKRKQNTKNKKGKGKKCRKKGGKGGKVKRARSRQLNIIRAHSCSPQSKTKRRNDDAENTMDASMVPSGSSAVKGKRRKTAKAEQAVPKTPVTSNVDSAQSAPAPKRKAKAKAAPKSKAKNKTPKPKVAAKAKAKAKSRGRPKSQANDPKVIRAQLMGDAKYAKHQVDDITSFCDHVTSQAGDKPTSPEFKKFVRSLIPDHFQSYAIQNIYWTRGSVGVMDWATGRDILHFSFNQSAATEAARMAAAVKCAIIAATQHGLKSISIIYIQ